VFKKLGIGKSLLIYIGISGFFVCCIGWIFFGTSQMAVSSLTEASEKGLSSLQIQNSVVKSMALVQSNIMPITADPDKDSRDIRVDIVKGFMSEVKKLLETCGNECSTVTADFAKFDAKWNELINSHLSKNDLVGASHHVVNELNPIAESLFDKLDKAASEVSKQARADFESAHLKADNMKKFLMVLIFALVGAILATGYIFQKKLISALEHVVEMVRAAVTNTAHKTEEINASSDTLSNATAKQAAAIQETVASIEEMSSMISRNAEHAKLAAQLSAESSSAASSGGTEIAKLISSMKVFFSIKITLKSIEF